MTRHIDLDNPPEECKPYVELYERTHKELKETKLDNRRVREVNEQIRSERDYFKSRADDLSYDLAKLRARVDAMLSKPDPSKDAVRDSKPWAHALDGQVFLGFALDGSDEEPWTIEDAESIACSLWNAAKIARTQERKIPYVDPNHNSEARNLCICCDCNGHEVITTAPEGSPFAALIGICRFCKNSQAQIDVLEGRSSDAGHSA